MREMETRLGGQTLEDRLRKAFYKMRECKDLTLNEQQKQKNV